MSYASPYKPEFDQQVIEFLAKGYSIESFAGEISVTRQTVYKWREMYPSFGDSVTVGLDKRTKFYENALLRLGLTGKGNAAALIFLSKNMTGMRDVNTQETVQKILIIDDEHPPTTKGESDNGKGKV